MLQAKQGDSLRGSLKLLGYCTNILDTAVNGNASRAMPVTMPPYGQPSNAYAQQAAWLKRLCASENTAQNLGNEVTMQEIPQEQNFLSPPHITNPLFACTRNVHVLRGVVGARLRLHRIRQGSTIILGEKDVRSPFSEDFILATDLAVGDVLFATQEIDGKTSPASALVTVEDNQVKYPNGLPAPTIEPSFTYRCASRIAVRHLPGATIHVTRNMGVPYTTRGSGLGHSVTYTDANAGAFAVGDSIQASQSICSTTSPMSDAIIVQQEISVLPSPYVEPTPAIAGQRLFQVIGITEGAELKVTEDSAGQVGFVPSWPFTRHRYLDVEALGLGRPVQAGEIFTVSQHLCANTSSSNPAVVVSCSQLGAPRISVPMSGDQFVLVTKAYPGARIRIWSEQGDMIADGSGDVLYLSRPLEEDELLQVVQSVGSCSSDTSFLISVKNPDPSILD